MKRLSGFWVLGLLWIAGSPLRAEDLSNRFGISGILGAGFPTGPQRVTDLTDSAGFGFGFQGSFFVGPKVGVGVSWEKFNLGNGRHISPIDVSMLFRLFPDRPWTPTFQLGAGSAESVNSSRIENLNVKAGIGLDWFLSSTLAVGPQVNYYYVTNSSSDDAEAHMVSANLLVSYYFAKP